MTMTSEEERKLEEKMKQFELKDDSTLFYSIYSNNKNAIKHAMIRPIWEAGLYTEFKQR